MPTERDDVAGTDQRRAIRGLGEVLRTERLDEMVAFYGDVLGLDLLERSETSAFFRVAEGVDGHTQVFVLFDRTASDGYASLEPARTTLDHVASSVERADFDAELARLRGLGLAVDTATHEWVGWRALYVSDPEGNRVELSCFDPSVGA